MSAVRPIGIAVVGCGGAAVDLCRAIDALPEARLVATHDHLEPAARDLALPRGATVHPSLEDVLGDPTVEVVYVALPHDLLAPTAARVLASGRHALVEKPVGLDVAAIERLAATAADAGLAVGAVFELREVAAVVEAHRLVRAGALGDLRAVRIRTIIDKPLEYWSSGPTGRRLDGWRTRRGRAGGGVVLMNAIHQLDLVRHVTGHEFVRASGEVATTTPGVEVEDGAAAVLRLSGGALVSLTATAHSPGAMLEERISIDGTDGRLDLPDPYGHDPLRAFLRRPWSGLAADTWTTIAPPPRDPHVELLRAYLAAVRGGGPVPVGLADAAAALAAVLAIYRSAATGRAVALGPDPT